MIAKEGHIFNCEIVGNVIDVEIVGGRELVSCAQKMTLKEG